MTVGRATVSQQASYPTVARCKEQRFHGETQAVS
jgi:hypothetical protein